MRECLSILYCSSRVSTKIDPNSACSTSFTYSYPSQGQIFCLFCLSTMMTWRKKKKKTTVQIVRVQGHGRRSQDAMKGDKEENAESVLPDV